MDLTEVHQKNLQGLVQLGFRLAHYPLFPSHIGIEKFGCATLLRPAINGRLEIAATPGTLLEGHIAVLVERGGEPWLVWKSLAVKATAERLQALRSFQEELEAALALQGAV
jgi:hypothetical protein